MASNNMSIEKLILQTYIKNSRISVRKASHELELSKDIVNRVLKHFRWKGFHPDQYMFSMKMIHLKE